jgi:alpha-1,2-mannosyltransferase
MTSQNRPTSGQLTSAPSPDRRQPPPVAARIAILVLLAATLVVFLVVADGYRIDLDVYRLGAQQWLNGADLYGPMPHTQAGVGLPFTYPPAAAILFAPLALVPYSVASVAMTVVSVGALLLVLALALGWRREPLGASGWAVLAVLTGALWLEPVRATISFGQVNIVLMALVAADVLLPRTPWPRGALVGLAAAIKLTPIVFVLTFVVRRQPRAAVTTIVSFVVVTAVAALAAPTDSWNYWTKVLWDTGRIGGPVYAGNQSLHAVLLRMGLPAQTALWLLGSAALVGLTVVAMRRAERSGWTVLVLTLNALLVLLVSPVSWTHHWVWIAPLLVALWQAGAQGRALRVLAVVGAALAVAAPMWRLPQGDDVETSWSWWQQVVGASYVLYALAVLVTVLVVAVDARGEGHAPT